MRSFRMALAVTTLALGSFARAAETDDDTIKTLDEALKAVSTFEHGQNAEPLVQVERIVFTSLPDSPLRAAMEQKLVEAMQSAATSDAKRFLCTQLRVIGTAKCIPALERLLTDPEVSHMARYALGRMETPGASEALLRALGKTSSLLQVGIINTLADRGCEKAKPEFVKLVGSPDPNVARAAARGLGRLGGADAAEALRAARARASDDLAAHIDNALLGCAEQLAASGETARAAAIYQTFYKADQPLQLRCAGLRGLVLTLPSSEAVPLLRDAIPDADLQRTAIAYIPLVKGEKAALAFASVLDALAPEGQVLLLHALGQRGDPAASGVMWRATKSPEETVRIAAIEALGQVSGASGVPVLTEAAAAAEGTEKTVARASLARLRGDDVNRKLLEAARHNNAAVRGEAIHALGARGATEAVGALLEATGDAEPSVRREAIQALGALAGAAQLPAMIQLAVAPKQADDRSAVEEAVGRVLLRIEDKRSSSQAVLAAIERAPKEAQPTLVRLLAKSGSPEALAAVRAAVGNADPAIAEAAVVALSQWPDASVTDDLLKLVATARNPDQKSIALEGFVRIAAAAENPTAMYLRVLDLVEQVNDKKLVLERLGMSDSSDSAEVLQLTEKFLDDKQLGPAAGLATLRIANRMKDQDAERARAALKKVIDTVDHADVRQRAQEVLNDMDKFEGHILQWVGAGPFTEKGKDGAAVYATAFEPEQPNARGVKWQPISKGIGSWDVNLEATFGGLDYCAAYLRTRVWSEIDQNALLEMGSDDGIKAWLNGKLVFDQWSEHGAAPRQERAPVKLAKGWNELMLKVVDQQGGWVAACRVRKPDGTPLDGLKIEAQ